MPKKIEWTEQDRDDSDILFEGMMSSARALEPEVDVERMSKEERAAFERMQTSRLNLYTALTSPPEAKPPAKRGRPRKKPGDLNSP